MSSFGDGVSHDAPLLALTLTRDPMARAAAPTPYAAGPALAVCGAGMGATMVLAPSLRQAIVPAHLMGRVASTSRTPAMRAAPLGAFPGGWPATAHDVRTPLCAAGGLLLAMTAGTASMTDNRRVEAALRAAARAGPPASGEPAREKTPAPVRGLPRSRRGEGAARPPGGAPSGRVRPRAPESVVGYGQASVRARSRIRAAMFQASSSPRWWRPSRGRPAWARAWAMPGRRRRPWASVKTAFALVCRWPKG